MERMPENIITILELWPDDPDFNLQHYAARCLREAYAEIDLLTAKGQEGCKHEGSEGICTHPEISFDGVLQPCVKGPCPYEGCAQKGWEDV